MQDELISALQPFGLSGFVFHREDGSLITPQMQRRLWRRIQKATGFKGTAYQLRRNMGTMMAEQGVSDKAAQCIMGHSNIATTLKYYGKPTKRLLDIAGDQLKKGFSELSM